MSNVRRVESRVVLVCLATVVTGAACKSGAPPVSRQPHVEPTPAMADPAPALTAAVAANEGQEKNPNLSANDSAATATPEPVCDTDVTETLTEPEGPKKHFSLHGYVAKNRRLVRKLGAVERVHCLSVAWPPGAENTEGQPSTVAQTIRESWFRALENTLARVPWRHATVLHRVVIDNRPKGHGIAAFDRESPDDARNGHTMWLNEHLFRDPNHWIGGNYGKYWAYHTNQDGKTFAKAPADHDLFSPVLLHELGHLVMYNVVNPKEEAAATPPCAVMCADAGNCRTLSPREREQNCISPYCKAFDFEAGTENFAEQYRFHYQSSKTRRLLNHAQAGCAALFAQLDVTDDEVFAAPWEQGLPESEFRPSRWKSCGNTACKGY